MTKDELLDEGRLQREIAQDLADSGMPLRQALSLGKWLAGITIDQWKTGDLLSWLTVHVMSSAAKDSIKLGPDFFGAMELVLRMRDSTKEHILEGFASLEKHNRMAKLLELISASKWDEAIAHVKLSALGAKASQD